MSAEESTQAQHRQRASFPNPGSEAAIKAGCKCPVIDNGRGRGYMGQPGIFVYSGDCELHADKLPKQGD